MQPTNAAYGGRNLAFQKRPKSIENDIREKQEPIIYYKLKNIILFEIGVKMYC